MSRGSVRDSPWSPAGGGVLGDAAVSPKMVASPSGGVKSPMAPRNSQRTSPLSAHSPSASFEIDDDLMNEALIL